MFHQDQESMYTKIPNIFKYNILPLMIVWAKAMIYYHDDFLIFNMVVVYEQLQCYKRILKY